MELILILGATIAALAVWKEHMRERKFQESLDKMKDFFEENPDFLRDDEEEWYNWEDATACEMCDDVAFEDDAILTLLDEEGDYMYICEFCLNPDLKD